MSGATQALEGVGGHDWQAARGSLEPFVVGVSYKNAPMEVLERISFVKADISRALLSARLSRDIHEIVILSTCNRVEIYATAEDETVGVAAVHRFWAEHHRRSLEAVQGISFVIHGEAAAAHLLSVACGLESMVIGERQILDQVRSALRMAEKHGAAGETLTSLFRHAIQVARRARKETNIELGAPALTRALVKASLEHFGSLAGRAVLVIGAGTIGRLAAEAMVATRARVIVTNRRAWKAEQLANRVGCEHLPIEMLTEALVRADVLLAATGSSSSVVTREMVAAAMSRRPNRPLLIVDVAIPHDVESTTRTLDGVRLLDLKSLLSLGFEGEAQIQPEIARVQDIVRAEAILYRANDTRVPARKPTNGRVT